MIRVSDPIKTRLNLVKGKSYEDKIELMLDYFDATGSDPSKRIANPIFEVERQVERVVKILRKIEKDKINNILKLLEILNTKGLTTSDAIQGDFTAEELEKIQALKEQYEESKNYIEQLEKQLRENTKNELENKPA